MKKKNRPGQQAANQHIDNADFTASHVKQPALNAQPAPIISSSKELLISYRSRADIDEITVIRFEGCSVRVVSIAGEPWFVAKDVCAALGIVNSRDALKALDEDEKNSVALTYGNRGNPNHSVVAESGFYKLIARSRKASTPSTFAHRFTNWIFREVIPSIRKNGAYGVPFTLLNDFSRRKAAYVKKASRRGHALQACRSEKERLAAEEAELWHNHQPQLAGVNDA